METTTYTFPEWETCFKRFDRAKHRPGLRPTGVYFLREAIDIDLVADALAVLNHQIGMDAVYQRNNLAVRQSDYANVKAAYESHVSMVNTPGLTEPADLPCQYQYFLVVTHSDWQNAGVLLVNLSNTHLEGRVDAFMCEASQVGIACANLIVGNMDYDDYKENNQVSGSSAFARSLLKDPNV